MKERKAPQCGHPNRKLQAKGMCAACYTADYERRNPDKGSAAWRKRNPDRVRYVIRRSHYKRKFGISVEEYFRLWDLQDGKCGNRGCDFVGTRDSIDFRRDGLNVDHDHQTGAVRGLLCTNCNTLLGRIEKTPLFLDGLLEYLSKHR